MRITHFETLFIHRWIPCHRETAKRSHVDKTIALLKIGERYVPIVETAIEDIKEDTDNGEGDAERQQESAM